MRRLGHMNLRTADPVASVRFYRSLGMQLTGCMRMGALSTLYMRFPDDAGAVLEISTHAELPDDWARVEGTGHLAVETDDFDGVCARLIADGYPAEGDAYHPGDRENLTVRFFRDPDNIRVEIIDGRLDPPRDTPPMGLVLDVS